MKYRFLLPLLMLPSFSSLSFEKDREDYRYVRQTCEKISTGRANYSMCARYGYSYPIKEIVFPSSTGVETSIFIRQARGGSHVFESEFDKMYARCSTTCTTTQRIKQEVDAAFTGFATAVKNDTLKERKTDANGNKQSFVSHATDVLKATLINKLSAPGTSANSVSNTLKAKDKYISVRDDNGVPYAVMRIGSDGTASFVLKLLPDGDGNSYTGPISQSALNHMTAPGSIFWADNAGGGASCVQYYTVDGEGNVTVYVKCKNTD